MVLEPAKDEYAKNIIPKTAEIIYITVSDVLERLILAEQFIIRAIEILPKRKTAGAEKLSLGIEVFLYIW